MGVKLDLKSMVRTNFKFLNKFPAPDCDKKIQISLTMYHKFKITSWAVVFAKKHEGITLIQGQTCSQKRIDNSVLQMR